MPSCARPIALLLAVCAPAAGCGGPPSDRSAIATAVRQFASEGQHPTARLCDMVSERFLQRVTRLRGDAALARCRARVPLAGPAPPSAATLGSVRVENLRVRGRQGSADAVAAGQPRAVVHLVKEHDAWKIDSVVPR